VRAIASTANGARVASRFQAFIPENVQFRDPIGLPRMPTIPHSILLFHKTFL
jgi:hypothetical protein